MNKGNIFWGIVLVAIGFVWLGNNLDWFRYEIPWVAVGLIAGGVYLIIHNLERSDSSKDSSQNQG